MIEIYNREGVAAIVVASDIKALTVAGTSSQWHGVACYVRLGDGSTIESSQSADTLRKLIEAEEAKSPAAIAVVIEHLAAIRESLGDQVLDDIKHGISELDSTMSSIRRNLS